MAPLLLQPARNVVPNLVYAETGANVVLNMVAGRVIYRNGRFTLIDETTTKREIESATARFVERVLNDPAVSELPIVRLTAAGLH